MSLKQHLPIFINNQSVIIKHWIEDIRVKKILQEHKLEEKFFISEYAFPIMQYYFDVVSQKAQIGNCPAVESLISYLKQNDITSSELFLLCSSFRNALIVLCFDNSIASKETLQDISAIYEENFSAVLLSYTSTVKDVELKLDQISSMVDKYIIMSQTDVNGMIINVSDAFCRISGYSKKELIGRTHNIVRHPDMPAALFDKLWETIKSGKKWQGEIKNLGKDGRVYWVNATIEPIIEQGKIIAFNAIRQDITLAKKVEDQQSMIIEQSKSAAMGEMISMIAHQWRQPLQAVSILTQKLPLTKMIEGELSDEILEQVVDDVSLQLDYMSKTIDDFRNFFKPDKNKEKVRLSELILKVKDILSYILKIEKVTVKLDYDEDVNVYLHYNEVMQVFINIIKNACDAMIEHKISNRMIRVHFYKKEEDVVIEIEDNAGGVKKEIQNKIFDPYYSTKSNKNGTGLGLYMSKTIIEEHSNGQLSVSNGKHGAIFKIILPLEKE
ncbi:MAG: PAS domain-containing sensor histidine kinase [Campylobacterota bacterium]|nr:PAS domain-containing sensor histidine kinase [Campylobacterota bacterium]